MSLPDDVHPWLFEAVIAELQRLFPDSEPKIAEFLESFGTYLSLERLREQGMLDLVGKKNGEHLFQLTSQGRLEVEGMLITPQERD